MAEWRESGVVRGKVWLLSNDHDFDDECDDNARRRRDPDRRGLPER
jgi:hypothetical protein